MQEFIVVLTCEVIAASKEDAVRLGVEIAYYTFRQKAL
jgi:hypothetical protein